MKKPIHELKSKFIRLLKNILIKDQLKNNFEINHRILVGTHHKTGTVWMARIFREISRTFNLDYYSGEQSQLPENYDIFFHNHSKFDLDAFNNNYRGLHLIRDPRDRIVSGCFYHKKSNEPWLHIKQEKFGGMTYQEKINSYNSLDDQLLFEMENAGTKGIREMTGWKYKNPLFFEAKYEELIKDENLVLFHEIFTFLGFPGSSIPKILNIAYRNSLFSGTVKKSLHVRSGKSKQWKQYFTPEHKKRFTDLFGDALIKLKYESNNDWAHD